MVTWIGVLAAESFPDADDVDGDGDCCDGVLEQEASARIPTTINMSDRAPRERAGVNETIISLYTITGYSNRVERLIQLF